MGKCGKAGVAAGLLAAFAGFVVLVSRDDPPPQDADLRARTARVADAGNVYPINLEMNAAPPMTPEERSILYKASKGQVADASVVRRLLADGAPRLALFARFARGSVFQDPTDIRPAALGTGAPIPQFLALVDAARLDSLRSEDLLRRGRAPEALDEALRIVDAGRVLLRSRGQLIEPLAGMIVANIGAGRVQEVVREGKLDRARLLAAAARLSAPTTAAESVKAALRYEYVDRVRVLDHVLEFAAKAPELKSGLGRYRRATSWYVYQPNRTRALFASRFRALIAEADKPCLRTPPFAIIPMSLAPNNAGRILYDITLPSYGLPAARRCEADFRLTAAAAAAALQAYRLDHGRFPASLADLAPGYLSAPPIDAFTGEAPLYSAETGEIHSAGKDADGKPL